MEEKLYELGPYIIYKINSKLYIEYVYGHGALRRSEITAEEAEIAKDNQESADEVVRTAKLRDNNKGVKWFVHN